MQAYQKLTGSSGRQVALFPLDVLHVTQGIDGSYSHQGSNAMDFVGTSPLYPMYAPCDLISVWKITGHIAYTSLAPVDFVDGTSDYLTIMFVHDDDVYNLGRVVRQGEPIAKTGTTGNVTGDHIHIEVKRGSWQGLIQNSYGVYQMPNNLPPFQLLAINNTVVINDFGYPWKEYQTGIPIWML